MISRLQMLIAACCLGTGLCLTIAPAGAVEAGAGTKNFSPPSGIPDHFSNEAEPFRGETAAEGPAPRSTVSAAPRARSYASSGRSPHHGGRSVHRRSARYASARGGHAGRFAAHAAHGHAATHTAQGHAGGRRHVASAHRRG